MYNMISFQFYIIYIYNVGAGYLVKSKWGNLSILDLDKLES